MFNQKRDSYDESVSNIGSKLGQYIAIIVEDPGTQAACECINPMYRIGAKLRSFTVSVILVKSVDLDPQGVPGVMFNNDQRLLFSPRDLLRKANEFETRFDVQAMGTNGRDFIESITKAVYNSPEDAIEICTRLNQVFISQLDGMITEYETIRDQMQDINRATISLKK